MKLVKKFFMKWQVLQAFDALYFSTCQLIYISDKPHNKVLVDLAYLLRTREISDLCFCTDLESLNSWKHRSDISLGQTLRSVNM